MAFDARLDVRVWSVGEGATQQQSGGVVLAAGASARPVLKTRVELHQHKDLAIRERRHADKTRFEGIGRKSVTQSRSVSRECRVKLQS